MTGGATPRDDPAEGASAARVHLVALAALLGLGAVLAVVALVSGGGDSEDARLRVERFPTPTGVDLIVYVKQADNQPATAGVARRCASSART